MRIRFNLTKAFIRVMRGAKLTAVENFASSDGSVHPIYLFHPKKQGSVLGQTTPWGTILISDYIVPDKDLFNFVVLHESRHASRWFHWYIALFIIGIVWFNSIWGSGIPSLILIFVLVVLSWYSEYDADAFAINKIGMAEFKRIMGRFDGPLTLRRIVFYAWSSLTHPPNSFVIWLFRLTHH
jgi:hypothetical protein